MFTQTFQLTRHPFEEVTPIEHILHDERFRKALERLAYFREHGSIAMVTGSTGVGKSTLLESFLQTLSPHRHRPARVCACSVGPIALLRMLVAALGEKPALGKDRLFRQIHQKTSHPDQSTLLILDEAHLLGEATLTELRLLIAHPKPQPGALKILLCGQPPLGRLLARASLEDLAGRISVRAHLSPLTREQSVCYIDHRLKQAAAPPGLFEPQAKHLLHEHAAGNCRAINLIATTCLIHAASSNIKRITPDIVSQAAAEAGRC